MSRRPAMKICVLAGSRREFEGWLAENGRTDSEAEFGFEPRVMQGAEFSGVVVYGSFWDRRDADDLYELAFSRVGRRRG